jgi:hypothetical protein
VGGAKGKSLMEAASGFIHKFETLVKVILVGTDKAKLLRKQLALFDSECVNI